MKIIVEHDASGNIVTVGIVPSARGFRIRPSPRAGNTVSEVDAPGLVGEPGSPAFDRKIQALMKGFAVQVGPAKLVKRRATGKGAARQR